MSLPPQNFAGLAVVLMKYKKTSQECGFDLMPIGQIVFLFIWIHRHHVITWPVPQTVIGVFEFSTETFYVFSHSSSLKCILPRICLLLLLLTCLINIPVCCWKLSSQERFNLMQVFRAVRVVSIAPRRRIAVFLWKLPVFHVHKLLWAKALAAVLVLTNGEKVFSSNVLFCLRRGWLWDIKQD